MLRRLVLLVCFALVASAGLPPGHPLADVPISQAGGKKLDLKKYRGKALVLTLISTTCGHCAEVLDVLKKLQQEDAVQGLQVVVAAGDDNAATAIGPYAAEHKLNFPLGFVD